MFVPKKIFSFFMLISLKFFTLGTIFILTLSCKVRDESRGSELKAFTPLKLSPVSIMSNINGKVQKVTGEQLESFFFLSHGKILTWDGIVNDWKTATPSVHAFDTEKFPGHLEYAQKGLNRGAGLTQDLFFTEVQFPATRKYMPFTVFDLRSKPMIKDNKTFQWALQMRRYNYRDTEVELALFVEKTKNLIKNAMGNSMGEPLIIAYTTPNSFRRPHVKHLQDIQALGMTTLAEEDFISNAGGNLVNVLNPGVGVGFLKLIKTDSSANEILTPKNIVIYEDSPERIPPVGGIITMDPQTPLSHVNLLAKNRGTFNVSTRNLASIPNLESNIGKLVKIEAKSSGEVIIAPIDQKSAEAFWESIKKPPLDVPLAEDRISGIVTFAETKPEDLAVNLIGSKASNYAFIQRLLGDKIIVPGHAIGFGLYKKIAKDSGAQTLVDSLLEQKLTLTPEQIVAKLSEIRTTITTKTPKETLDDIVSQVRQLQNKLTNIKKIRFRSSTNSEDLPGFNGAGLYESTGFKFKDTDDVMREALLFVMSSLWLDRAFFERDVFNLDHSKVAMAIQINPSFSDEDANGVILAYKEAGRFIFSVNSQKGEASVTNPENGEIPESLTLLDNNTDLIRNSSTSNIGSIFIQPTEETKPTLIPEMVPILLNLKQQTEAIDKAFQDRQKNAGDLNNYGIDIEFKIMNEGGVKTPFIKQARLLLLNKHRSEPFAKNLKRIAARKTKFGGGHIRVSPSQLSDLNPLDFCLVPEGQTLGADKVEDAGSFFKVKIADNRTDCYSYNGEFFLFKEHFQVVK